MFFLQVGLAVGDTEKIKTNAAIKRLGMQLEYQIEIEEAYPMFIIRKAYQKVYVEEPNKLSRSYRWGLSLSAFIFFMLNITILVTGTETIYKCLGDVELTLYIYWLRSHARFLRGKRELRQT